jgi:hypothetical protein
MSAKYRAQILLEPEQHEALAEIAQRQNRSISNVVREILNDWLSTQERASQRRRELEALEELTRLRLRVQERHGIYIGDPVEEIRAGIDEDIARVWRGDE